MSKYCPNCGHENRDVAEFCGNCGNRLPVSNYSNNFRDTGSSNSRSSTTTTTTTAKSNSNSNDSGDLFSVCCGALIVLFIIMLIMSMG